MEGLLEVDLCLSLACKNLFLSPKAATAPPTELNQLTEPCKESTFELALGNYRFHSWLEEGAGEDTASFSSIRAAQRILQAGVCLQAADCKSECTDAVLGSQRDAHKTLLAHSFIHISHGFLFCLHSLNVLELMET